MARKEYVLTELETQELKAMLAVLFPIMKGGSVGMLSQELQKEVASFWSKVGDRVRCDYRTIFEAEGKSIDHFTAEPLN